jgi:2-iminobutanoate/2-iminopropanoate deaminase
MSKKEIKQPGKKTSTGAYSSGIECDGWIYVAGQGPVDLLTGKVRKGTIEQQTLLTLHNVEKVLKAAGCTRDDVVKCTCYLQDISQFGRFNKAYGEFFQGIRPARTTVGANLARIKVEIDAIARIPRRK